MTYFVYILANRKRGTTYIGVTRNLARRIYQHKTGLNEGFTKQYNVKKLVHMELFDRMIDAIQREKNLKFWKQSWKYELIERDNPEWIDLYDTLNQ